MNSSSLPAVVSDGLQAAADATSIHPRKRVTTNFQRWFVAALLAFFVLLSIQYSYKAIAGRSAFVRWRSQIEHLDDADIYQRFNYPNPPIMALLLEWLVRMPPLVGSLAWFYLKVGMVLVSFYWVFHFVEGQGRNEERRWRIEDRGSKIEGGRWRMGSCDGSAPSSIIHPRSSILDPQSSSLIPHLSSLIPRPFPPWAKALTVLLSLRPIMGDLYHNNVNIFILFLLAGSLFAFSRGRSTTSGVILGLAIACKVTPALFIPYFLWKRAWGALAGCALGLILFLFVVPGLFLGMNRNLELLSSWERQMIEPFVVNGAVASEHNNQSLPGLVYRLATHSPSFSKFDYDLWRYTPLEYHNWLALTPKTAQWLLKGCMAAFVVLVIWTCRTPLSVASGQWLVASKKETDPSCRATSHWPPATHSKGWLLAAEFSLIVLGMLLFSERTWKHHCVTLLLPFATIVYYLATQHPTRKLRWFLIGILSTAALLMATTSTSGLVSWWDQVAKLAQVYGAYVWAYGCLIFGLVVVLRNSKLEARNSKHIPSTKSQIPEPGQELSSIGASSLEFVSDYGFRASDFHSSTPRLDQNNPRG
jgi:alpha-1,2-mannosyltransferase